jgi:hypothetical protein
MTFACIVKYLDPEGDQVVGTSALCGARVIRHARTGS